MAGLYLPQWCLRPVCVIAHCTREYGETVDEYRLNLWRLFIPAEADELTRVPPRKYKLFIGEFSLSSVQAGDVRNSPTIDRSLPLTINIFGTEEVKDSPIFFSAKRKRASR